MNNSFVKAEARQARYKKRARGARRWSHMVMLMLVVASSAALWMDEHIGPGLQQRVYAAIAELETAKDNENGTGAAFSAAFSKLVL